MKHLIGKTWPTLDEYSVHSAGAVHLLGGYLVYFNSDNKLFVNGKCISTFDFSNDFSLKINTFKGEFASKMQRFHFDFNDSSDYFSVIVDSTTQEFEPLENVFIFDSIEDMLKFQKLFLIGQSNFEKLPLDSSHI